MNIYSLCEAFDNKESIVNVERIQKRIYNRQENKASVKNTNNFIIIFKGRSLPDNINLYGGIARIRIRPFIPMVKQCFYCYKFGHLKNFCKNSSKKCVICGDLFHGKCDRNMKYINCGLDHKFNDKSYSLIIRKLWKSAPWKGVSTYEAKSILHERRKGQSNRWSDSENWPVLLTMHFSFNNNSDVSHLVNISGSSKSFAILILIPIEIEGIISFLFLVRNQIFHFPSLLIIIVITRIVKKFRLLISL